MLQALEMARRCHTVFVVIYLKLVLGTCEESKEVPSRDEYEQIFQEIPILFEYLLEILKERPEILEKDDTTFFQELPQEACEDNKRKREVCEQCGDLTQAEDDFKAMKKDIVMNYIGNLKTATNSDSKITSEVITSNMKPKTKTTDSNNDKNLEAKLNKDKSKTKNNKLRVKDRVKGKKRNVNTDQNFLGSVDWNMLYLSPEEVEEQALKVEQAIEDHNKKKDR